MQETAPQEPQRQASPFSLKNRFTTSDIIVISMFGALGIVGGILGNVLHGASGMVPIIGTFVLHTLIPGIIIFSCVATVRKAGAATLVCLITSLVSMPLMGAPLFIVMYLAYGVVVDGAIVLLGDRMWTRGAFALVGAVHGVVGILILYYVVLAAQGLVFPIWAVLPSIPLNILFAVPAALIGLKLGTRASSVLVG
jgi:hypothetical protein